MKLGLFLLLLGCCSNDSITFMQLQRWLCELLMCHQEVELQVPIQEMFQEYPLTDRGPLRTQQVPVFLGLSQVVLLHVVVNVAFSFQQQSANDSNLRVPSNQHWELGPATAPKGCKVMADSSPFCKGRALKGIRTSQMKDVKVILTKQECFHSLIPIITKQGTSC